MRRNVAQYSLRNDSSVPNLLLMLGTYMITPGMFHFYLRSGTHKNYSLLNGKIKDK